MEKQNKVSFKVYGRIALFSDPITRIGGEKFSYQVPTYQALKGILESIYWKPTIIWVIDRCRIMNAIQTHAMAVRTLKNSGNDLSYYTYLVDVEYQVEAHFIWNVNRPELVHDRNENKHWQMAKRTIKKGGRRDVYLGTRECQAYVEPCEFGEGSSFYETVPELALGTMFHGFNYPDETGKDLLQTRFWRPIMRQGIIEFIKPEDCEMVRDIKEMTPKKFVEGENFCCMMEGDDGYELVGKP